MMLNKNDIRDTNKLLFEQRLQLKFKILPQKKITNKEILNYSQPFKSFITQKLLRYKMPISNVYYSKMNKSSTKNKSFQKKKNNNINITKSKRFKLNININHQKSGIILKDQTFSYLKKVNQNNFIHILNQSNNRNKLLNVSNKIKSNFLTSNSNNFKKSTKKKYPTWRNSVSKNLSPFSESNNLITVNNNYIMNNTNININKIKISNNKKSSSKYNTNISNKKKTIDTHKILNRKKLNKFIGINNKRTTDVSKGFNQKNMLFRTYIQRKQTSNNNFHQENSRNRMKNRALIINNNKFNSIMISNDKKSLKGLEKPINKNTSTKLNNKRDYKTYTNNSIYYNISNPLVEYSNRKSEYEETEKVIVDDKIEINKSKDNLDISSEIRKISKNTSVDESGMLSLNEIQDIIKYFSFSDVEKNENYLFKKNDYKNFMKLFRNIIYRDFFVENQNNEIEKKTKVVSNKKGLYNKFN